MQNLTSPPALGDPSRRVPAYEKRGGYGSSSRLVTTLAPPPSGPAPGAREPASVPSGTNKASTSGHAAP